MSNYWHEGERWQRIPDPPGKENDDEPDEPEDDECQDSHLSQPYRAGHPRRAPQSARSR